MGHKVHPKIYRTPFIYPWDSKWYAKKENFPQVLKQEVEIRKLLAVKLKEAGIDAISIERTPKELQIFILAAKPGVIIGRSGQGLDILRKEIEKKCLQGKIKVKLNIQPVKQPALSAQIIGQNLVSEIEKRMPFRRVMKHAIEKVMAAGARGVKIKMSGRLNGVEIARREVLGAGKMSLITLRSDVDYAFVEAHTIYGKIGIKVWVYHGEVFGRRDKFAKKTEEKE
ncbi:MAG: 30S ribosomal protein S3 [Candidatus Magasanikbacteria bacterium CG10_big_fil_rev_8_21_14_0_10_36_32]|uniref:Small ribosomal subunit protein uS3 n=1 Tax=Candidatus Magasanikbacteria bacterium CG10_big_fil_rev_8_21_14_0_10_36_32 TaxID=1974646 RepID=A0A2M6W6S2_9BACT|nr:MAG: 30S ribosomal protein S3 [Candidatus Magasanikbacteria bacterium CG10_big_fil_rev_8_21_14_0_10_36_32]